MRVCVCVRVGGMLMKAGLGLCVCVCVEVYLLVCVLHHIVRQDSSDATPTFLPLKEQQT